MRSLGYYNYNPLNIRYSPMNNWKGQIGSNKGFCQFSHLTFGFRAALVLLCNYQRKGYDTIRKVISHWAPPTENNTEAYIRTVSDRLFALYNDAKYVCRGGDFSDQRITSFEFVCSLCLEMARVELGAECFSEHQDHILAAYHCAVENFKYPELKK
jgi:hypothetical protein